MSVTGADSLKTRRTLEVAGQSYDYFSLEAASAELGDVSRLPYSLKVLLENMLRYEDGRTVSTGDAQALVEQRGRHRRADKLLRLFVCRARAIGVAPGDERQHPVRDVEIVACEL